MSVSDPRVVADFLREVAGWEQIGRSSVDRALLTSWHLGEEVDASSWLFRNPGDEHGYVRLIRFEGAEQVRIRSGAQPWDTGGIFSLMVRTPDAGGRFASAQNMHWSSYSDPIAVDFGTSELRTVVLRGPDGINFSLYERVRPPLEGFENMRRFSMPFNAMQTVRDVDVAADFYTGVLGFGTWYRGGSAQSEPRVSNFAIPINFTTRIPTKAAILHRAPGETGRVELIQFDGFEGRDLAARAIPPNLGILSLRFPVENADDFAALVTERSAEIYAGPVCASILPYGLVNIFSVRAPDGVMLEFYSPCEAAG